MENINIEKYLSQLSSGENSALNVYNFLSNCNYNVGLTLNYFQERWVAAPAIQNRKAKGVLIFVEEEIQNFKHPCDVYVRNLSTYKFGENKEVVMDFKNPEHYKHLFADLNKRNIEIDTIIVHSSNGKDDTILKAYNLVKAIAAAKQNSSFLCLWLYKNRELNSCFHKALKGFAKTAFEEMQNIILRTVCIEEEDNVAFSGLDKIIESETSDFSKEFEVTYNKNGRMVKRFYFLEQLEESEQISFGGKPAYIVSGGHGVIGREIVKSLIEKGAYKVIIIGRSDISDKEFKEWFGENASKIQYHKADIAISKEVKTVHEAIKNNGYDIRGIINCSGVFNNSFIINKKENDISDVLAPKINGTIALHQEFINEKLDFFITFSSIAGVLGKIGQADYAYANCFLDNFTAYREELRTHGGCSGKTICINWPYWSEGGMAIDDYEIDVMYEQLGAVPLTNKFGIEAFNKVLNARSGSYTVLYGAQKKLREVLEKVQIAESFDNAVLAEYSTQDLKSKTNEWLIKVFKDTFGINDFDTSTGFSELGIDSVGFNRVLVRMEKQLGSVKKTLLYETKNIDEIADYLVETMSDKLEKLFCVSKPAVSPIKSNAHISKKTTESIVVKVQEQCDDIAVIGISGRFPNASNCEELWGILKNGVDCVGEIPKERWDVDYYYSSEIKNLPEGKSYCKWGGFLSDADKFDPQFFNMSPIEAAMTDPQERLMLEVAWEVFEDAGYTYERLKEISDENGNALVGTFMSTASNTYNLIGVEQWGKGNYIVPNSLPWSLSNRISYFMKFSAPSYTVDAACAGGLVAIHQAISSLKNNECKMALVGGANLYLHPYKYVSLSQVKMLSKTGKCYAFSDKADGFVPGESVACVLLKPLQAAKRDNDKIYGVIKASEINHDADSNGYMAPNPKAQELLISNAIKKAGISAKEISYIEAHGTGTPIGDPIEVNALSKAFRRTTSENQFCSIGSIKSNIGHSEGAAGIVGLIKVLLQMKYKTLVPSLHSEKLSPAIDFESSPFYVQRKLVKWNKPLVEDHGVQKECLRIAGVSSFGAGGANGHILVQEYEEENKSIHNEKEQIYILPISAKTQAQLGIYVDLMYQYITKNKDSLKISAVAYTLQRCRNEMEYRTAFVTKTLDGFIQLMSDYLNEKNSRYFISGIVKKNREKEHSKTAITDMETALSIAELWVQGSKISWGETSRLGPDLADLPTYPFAQKSCWVKTVNKTMIVQPEVKAAADDDLEVILQELASDKGDIARIIQKIETIDKTNIK